MRKRARRLHLQRETLRLLADGVVRAGDLRRAVGAIPPSARNCETASACSNLCIPSGVLSECVTACETC